MMNRREILQNSMLSAVGLLTTALPVGMADAAPLFKPLTHYWLKTRLWLLDHCEWHSEPVMRIVTQDGGQVWSWCVNQYDDEDDLHCQVNRDVPIDDSFGPLPAPVTTRHWHDFRWHLHFSDVADGMIEGWTDGKRVITVVGPNFDADLQELYYERPKNPCIRLSRVQWTVG